MIVREIIEISGWEEGSGYTYSQVYSNKICDVCGKTIEEVKELFDWDWYEKDEEDSGRDDEDLEITVKYYLPDDDITETEPFAEFTIWESEIPEKTF